jgi:hypothetical protein
VKTFALFLAALSIAGSAAAQPVPAARLRPVLQQLRAGLDSHRATLGATDDVTTVKHALRDWVESQVIAAPQALDPRTLSASLHAALRDADLLCADMIACARNFLGYLDDVRVYRAGDFLNVVTAVGVNCGYDESAYSYAWKNGRWQRFWESEQNTYTENGYRPQDVYDILISAPAADGRRLLVTLGAQTGCTGGFKNLYARAWRLNAALATTSVLDWTEYGNDGYPPLQGRVRPDDLILQYTAGGLADGETHTAVRHFEVRDGAAVQVDPIAGRPHDFVLEWLSAPWEQSRTRAASPTLQAAHTALHLEHPYGDFPEPTRRCTAGADLWQVATKVFEGPLRYYRVRWEAPFRFTMMEISESAFPDCTIADPRSEAYPPFLDRDLVD